MNSSLSPINESRIGILDGFRCIAVMAVVLYHYYYWFGGVVPLPDYPQWTFLDHGYFGVHLFFMISGFVIYRSMEQSNAIKEFLGKRYLRLAPALMLCSVVTFVMIEFWNDSERILNFGRRTPYDLLFSFTLVHPEIWNTLLGKTDIKFIDGSYWSLWPEIIFYISSSIVFFNSKRENFLRNWFVLVLILNILRIITSPRIAGYTPDFMLPFSQAYYSSFLYLNISYWPYFSVGILFYTLWMKRAPSRLVWTIVGILFCLELFFIALPGIRLLFVVVIGLWLIFLWRPRWLSFLHWRPVQLIGLISYPLYLSHETAGLVLTEKLIAWTNHSIPVVFLLTAVLAVFILFSYFVFAVFEKPVTRLLKQKLLGLK